MWLVSPWGKADGEIESDWAGLTESLTGRDKEREESVMMHRYLDSSDWQAVLLTKVEYM